jgi:membrane protein
MEASPLQARTRLEVRPLIDGVIAGFKQHDLLSYASAIAFQVLWALVPLTLFGLALAGVLGLDAATVHVAQELRGTVSPAAGAALDEAIRTVVSSREWLWLTAGLLLTVWELSGAVRAMMNALDRIYGADGPRPFRERLRVSLPLAVVVGACLLGAVFCVRVLPSLLPVHAAVLGTLWAAARWAAAVALLLAAVWLLIRFAPAVHQPAKWVTLGSGLCVAAWVIMSVAFGLYLNLVADYETLFGGLASIFVLASYLYFSCVVFLGGAQVDATLRALAKRGA